MKKWLLITLLTQRYKHGGSRQAETDTQRFANEGLRCMINIEEHMSLTNEYWQLKLPETLKAAVSSSLTHKLYVTAQNYLENNALFYKKDTVHSLTATKRNLVPLFSKDHLKSYGITDNKLITQAAKYVVVPKKVAQVMQKSFPAKYFSQAFRQCVSEPTKIGGITLSSDLLETLANNCIPNIHKYGGVTQYEAFLAERKGLMAIKIREYYESI